MCNCKGTEHELMLQHKNHREGGLGTNQLPTAQFKHGSSWHLQTGLQRTPLETWTTASKAWQPLDLDGSWSNSVEGSFPKSTHMGHSSKIVDLHLHQLLPVLLNLPQQGGGFRVLQSATSFFIVIYHLERGDNRPMVGMSEAFLSQRGARERPLEDKAFLLSHCFSRCSSHLMSPHHRAESFVWLIHPRVGSFVWLIHLRSKQIILPSFSSTVARSPRVPTLLTWALILATRKLFRLSSIDFSRRHS